VVSSTSESSAYDRIEAVEITIEKLKQNLLDQHNPRRVRLYGVVVESEVNDAGDFGTHVGIIDDSTGRIHFKSSTIHKVKQLVKIIGDVVVLSNGLPVIHADVLQDYSKVDMDLFNRIRKLKAKIEQKE
jgi:hypothetical protein